MAKFIGEIVVLLLEKINTPWTGLKNPYKMIHKIYFKLLISAITFYCGIWCFNNISAWLGIFIFALPIYYLINQIYKQIKQKQK